MTFPTYFEAFDAKAMLTDYPLDMVGAYGKMSADELRALQDVRFVTLMQRGWEIPFYRKLWRAKGLEPGDIDRKSVV